MKRFLVVVVALLALVVAFSGVALADEWAVAPTLSAAEAAGLQWMREEEKLARDVYQTLYTQWGFQTFQNIARSEQSHMNAVKTLLDRYSVADPVGSNSVGVFTDPQLQVLYNDLVARGGVSLADALAVGAEIEELDIVDLQVRVAQTDKADIRQVYTNLERGSDNHLRAFVTTLQRVAGVTYVPQHLSQAAYDAVIAGGGQRGGPRWR